MVLRMVMLLHYEQPAGSTALSGFVSGRQYKITKPVTANTFLNRN